MADAEKTEDATPKRIADARKKGNVLRSQDVTTAVILLVALLMFRWRWEPTAESLSKLLTTRLGRFPIRDLNVESLFRILMEDATVLLNILFPFLLALILAGIFINYLMVGPLFTVESMRPDLTKLNPITGAKRFFSARAFVELFKGVLKLIIVGAIVYQVLAERYPPILQGFRMRPSVSGPLIADAAWTLGLRCVIALIIIAVLDYYWQRYDYQKSLKMSKQEVKDESRQQEGDPLVKSEIRKRMRQAARRRMMQQVPRATVVITNPTHFAVALRYEKDQGIEVPVCVAKGADDVALRIRAIAQENNVPIVENPPLARELFRLVELGDLIPQDLYLAVAEILVNLHKVRPERVAL
jgi:flagellar biosynthetic protein FlhB